ncbi:MAG: hypothetical protein OXL97_00705 [Chloroflexota bacterium]|nr:hypothetical protein [Chloroflexota bacterium]MDE2883663.1 hypothetical protein [Chloroflexota bacterium]
MLEEAQRERVIDVAAMYEAGKALLVFLNRPQSVTLGDAVHQYIERKARERVRAVGGYSCVLRADNCDHGVFGIYTTGYLLPASTVYDNIVFRTGGSKASHADPGSPAYRQVWPPVIGSAGVPADFDVSGVDLTSVPALDCVEEQAQPLGFFPNDHCSMWLRWFPSFRVGGYYSSHYHSWLHVKTPEGKEEATLAAAKRTILAWRPGYVEEDEFTLIPVKYDLEDWWRWTVILNRFAQSPGNTLGITEARVRRNELGGYFGRATFTKDSGLREAARFGDPGFERGSEYHGTYRTTIHVRTLELERTLAALPRLLPQLNIPVDAVGVVAEEFQGNLQRLELHTSQANVVSSAQVETPDAGPTGTGLPAPVIGTGMAAIVVACHTIGHRRAPPSHSPLSVVRHPRACSRSAFSSRLSSLRPCILQALRTPSSP